MSSWVLAFVVFAVILGGSFGGMLLRNVLPAHHLVEDSKDLVRLGTGVIGTIGALVLCLLIASAKTSYDTQGSQVRELTANIILLDRLLAEYGPEANAARDALRSSIVPLVDQIWRKGSSGVTPKMPFEPTAMGEAAFHKVQELSPRDDNQRALQARAIQVFADLAHTRLLLFAQTDNPIPTPFLVVLVFWLTIIFASFSLFTRPNATVIAALLIFALSASGAIFLILELSQPFSGLMQVSSAPVRNALAPLGS
jgi:hypothetical protein